MIDDSVIWGTPGNLETAVDEIRHSHSKWSERVFLSWAKTAYEDIDYARRKNDPDFIAELLTPEFLEFFRESPEDETRNVIDKPLEVRGIQIAWIGQEGEFDVIDVRYIGERPDDKGAPCEVIEFLTFIRLRYEHFSDVWAAESTGRCFSCGGGIDAPDLWQCPHCGHNLAEQSTGWKVAYIWSEGDYVR